jgi:integral membrane protein
VKELAAMKDVTALRVVTLAEGVSFLALLLVAMPLKYWFDWPLAVRVAGGLHGLLFVGLGLTLYQARLEHGWRLSRLLLLLLWSVVPGSFWWMDQRIVKWAREGAEEHG